MTKGRFEPFLAGIARAAAIYHGAPSAVGAAATRFVTLLTIPPIDTFCNTSGQPGMKAVCYIREEGGGGGEKKRKRISYTFDKPSSVMGMLSDRQRAFKWLVKSDFAINDALLAGAFFLNAKNGTSQKDCQ